MSFREINWNAMKSFSPITPDIQEHLINVYTTLAVTILCSALGSFAYLIFSIGNTLTFFIGFVLLLGLLATPHQNVKQRFLFLFSFCFVQGMSISPLLQYSLEIDPSLLVTAFLGTVVVFSCFSAAAIFASRRSYLFLGGFLSSALSLLVLFGFINIFFKSMIMFNMLLYFGLLVFCGFIIFDTQLIIEQAASGYKDIINDSLTLFLDFLNIFIRLLTVLLKDKKERK